MHWCHCHRLVPESVLLCHPGLPVGSKEIRVVILTKVQLAAVSAFDPPVERVYIFTHPMSLRFIKGFGNLYSPD